MLSSYLRVAWRNLVQDRTYSFINILGLSIGLACCLLIIQYVVHEWSYDSFHEQSDRIYRAHYASSTERGESLNAQTPVGLAYTLKTQFPEVEEAVRLAKLNSRIEHNGSVFRQSLLLADSSFFDIFSFEVTRGNPSQLLASPNDAVVTEEFARAQFGEVNPVGKSLTALIDNERHSLTIQGTVKEVPSRSSIQFDVLVSYKKLARLSPPFGDLNNWLLHGPRTYLLLHPEASATTLEAHATEYLRQNVERRAFTDTRLGLTKLTDIHLSPEISGGLEPTSKPRYSFILVGIALFILALACINYVTLSLGRSSTRTEEVSIRKSFGGSRRQILLQFNGESIMLVLISLSIGLLLSNLLLPFFNELIGTSIDSLLLSTPSILFAILVFALIVGLLSGMYPSLIVSRFEPADIFSGRLGMSRNPVLTKSMVGIQFCLSIVLVVTLFTMQDQLGMMINRDVGFDKERVLVLEAPDEQGREIMRGLRNRLSETSSVVSISGSWNEFPSTPGVTEESTVQSRGREIPAIVINSEPRLINTLGIDIKNDEGLRRGANKISFGNVIVTEKLVASMGWDDPIGQKIRLAGSSDRRVAAVVENFHVQSLHEDIKPVVINPYPPMTAMSTIFVRIARGDASSTIDRLRTAWREAAPTHPFVYHFMDDRVEQLYQSEQRWAAVSKYASILGIFIACIGLFGLAVQNTVRRKKEIGIRKVLGANMSSILRLLSLEFLKPVVVGFAFAVPIGWYAMRAWLQGFAYHVELGAGIFLAAGALAVGVALLTVSYQAFRAAQLDPATTLRDE